jgi:hypothetical protein
MTTSLPSDKQVAMYWNVASGVENCSVGAVSALAARALAMSKKIEAMKLPQRAELNPPTHLPLV